MKRMSRSVVTLLTLAGVASAAPINLIAFATSAGTTTVHVCSASALTIAEGNGGAAAGNLGFPVLITNHGSAACSLDGFPTVTAHTRAASPHPVPSFTPHVRRSMPRPRPNLLSWRLRVRLRLASPLWMLLTSNTAMVRDA